MSFRKDFTALSREGKRKRMKVFEINGKLYEDRQVAESEDEDFSQPSTSMQQPVLPDETPIIPPNHYEIPQYCDSSSESSDSEDSDYDYCLEDKLREWADKFFVSTAALTALLLVLRAHHCFNYLPRDGRTIRKTPRSIDLKVVPPGHYFHFGIAKSLERMLSRIVGLIDICKIELMIGIDGLSLFKSSGSEVWPILGQIFNIPFLCEKVFPIGIYYGSKKPSDCSSFLHDFVEEITLLSQNGMMWKGKQVLVTVKGICCDAPAKAFVLGVKGHAGYYSCTRCKQKGVRFWNKVIFPDLSSPARTNDDFFNKIDTEFHTGDTILVGIPGLDFVKSIPLDYMHLVCLGVTRSLLFLWMFAEPPLKFQARIVNSISLNLQSLSSCIPVEFCRRPRVLNELKRWKATEFRQFLLYTGPVALFNALIPGHKDQYDNFMTLHIAMTILLHPKLCFVFNSLAKELLEIFLIDFQNLYGLQYMTHNFHNLVHLADDTSTFGNLDRCSAFPFENCLQTVKKLVRKGDRPLQQIVKRLVESSHSTIKENFKKIDAVKLSTPHSNGPCVGGCDQTKQFKKAIFQSFTITTSAPNNCCCLNDGSVVNVVNIIYSHQLKCDTVICRRYCDLEDFWNIGEPSCASSTFGIYKVRNLSPILEVFPLSEIKQKLTKMPLTVSSSLVIPLLHSET